MSTLSPAVVDGMGSLVKVGTRRWQVVHGLFEELGGAVVCKAVRTDIVGVGCQSKL